MAEHRSRRPLVSKIYSWYFTVPTMLLYLALFILPGIMGIYLSMTDWSVSKWDYSFIGLENFRTVFSDMKYLKYIGRTCWFALVTSVAKSVTGLILALGLNQALKTKNILRAMFFLPAMISPLIIGIIFRSVFHPNGILNIFLASIGLTGLKTAWLTDKNLAFNTVMFVETWRYAGFNMVIYLAGLQMIDSAYLEAAAVDGANSRQIFAHVTIPLIMPSITINTVLNVMSGLKVFDVVFSLTKGGPGDITDVLNTVIFREYSKGRYGFSTALGVILFILTSVIAFAVYFPLARKEVDN